MIVREAFATAAPGGGDITITINKPAGTVVGDVLVATIRGAAAAAGTLTPPTGWVTQVKLDGTLMIGLFYKVMGAGEPADYTFEYSQSASVRAGGIVRYSGVDNDTPSAAIHSVINDVGTSVVSDSITTLADDAMLVHFIVTIQTVVITLDTALGEVYNINRLNYADEQLGLAGATGTRTSTLSASANFSVGTWALRPGVTATNDPPTIVPNTADAAVLSEYPELEFTGTDPDGDDLTYQVSIADNILFEDGVTVVEEQTLIAGTVIHPNPAGGLTWEGYNQVDENIGMSFRGKGGILISADFNFGPHETTPELTDGSYLARIYEAEGHPVNPVPPIWVASTAYLVGDIIRPTSSANANVHFVYRCKVAGTSGSTEPTWVGNGVDWLSVTSGTENADGTVTWEALPGSHPVGAVAAANTPTPGWLAQSVVYPYNPGAADGGWKTLEFQGAERIRLEADKWYMVMLVWRPNSTHSDNTIAVRNTDLANANEPGNLFLEGSSTNNHGPRIITDSAYRVREELYSVGEKASNVDPGFTNTITPADTDPFNSGEKIKYTAQVAISGNYFWRARVMDPVGIGAWSDWTPIRSFTSSAPKQYARPSATLQAGGWQDQAGGSNLHLAIDEVEISDLDYIREGASPAIVALAAISDPGVNTGHALMYRFRKEGADARNVTISLYQAETLIASFQHTVTATWTTETIILTEIQAAQITDYSQLRLHFEVVA